MAKVHNWTMIHPNPDTDVSESFEYQCPSLPVFVQSEILRRVAPPLAARLAAIDTTSKVDFQKTVLSAISGLSDVKKEDYDYVVNNMLKDVKRRQTGANIQWASIRNGTSTAFQFDDITLMDMYAIMREVAEFSFGNFMKSISRTLNAQQPTS